MVGGTFLHLRGPENRFVLIKTVSGERGTPVHVVHEQNFTPDKDAQAKHPCTYGRRDWTHPSWTLHQELQCFHACNPTGRVSSQLQVANLVFDFVF